MSQCFPLFSRFLWVKSHIFGGSIPLFDHDLVGEESPWTPSSLAGQYHRQEVPEPEKKWHEKNGGFTTTHRTVQQQEEIEVD